MPTGDQDWLDEQGEQRDRDAHPLVFVAIAIPALSILYALAQVARWWIS